MSDQQNSSDPTPIKPVPPSQNPGTPVKRGLDAPKPTIKPAKPSPKSGTPYRFHDKHN